jgi:glycosyltransferase involved in cell wall biosynthesis
LTSSNARCLVLDPRLCRSRIDFVQSLRRFVADGWTIHLHTNGHNFNSWLLALLCGSVGSSPNACRILTLHSGMAPRYLAGGSWRRELARRACRLYARIICVSSAIQQAVIGLGVPPDLTEIAPAYIPPQLSTSPLEPLLLAWINKHQPVLSTVVFFRPEYGVDLLIAAMARLRRDHPSIGCLIMGSGEQRMLAQQQIHDARLEEHVLLLGDVEHSRCLDLISRCDVFLRPTLDDGDSISVREALSLGVPVVASRVGTRPDGVFLFEPGGLDDLLRQTEAAMDSAKPAAASVPGSMERLMEIYRQSEFAGRACA